MANALDRLRKLIGEEEEDEQEQSAYDSTPANAKSKAALQELRELGSTTYRGKTYTLPETSQSARAGTAGAAPAPRTTTSASITTPSRENTSLTAGSTTPIPTSPGR